MIYSVVCKQCGLKSEVQKPMAAALPPCHQCGGELRRVFEAAPSVQYHAGGFYATEHTRFESMVGRERAAKFQADKSDAERRAKRGQLTAYERALESI